MSIINDKHIKHIKSEKVITKIYNEWCPFNGTSLNLQSIANGSYFCTKQDDQNLYFLMDYYPGGELSTLFAKQRINMKISDIKLYFAEIVVSLNYLHSQKIVYRDLKLENIVIDKNGHLRLIDFGFSKRLKNKDRTYTRCGTEGYIAPEIMKNLGHGLPADIWSLGILF